MLNVFNKLKKSLTKTRSNVTDRIQEIFRLKKGLTEEMLEELEEALITADIGVDTTMLLIELLRERFEKNREIAYEDVVDALKKEIDAELEPVFLRETSSPESAAPYVILVVGVNGTGKTTTIGKLAHYYKAQGKRVMLAAGDTFRAAAIDQLEVWKKRTGVEIIKNKEGADPAAVAYDATQSAAAKNIDVLIIDTAGRIHTNVNLMQELTKIERVIKKNIPDAPHETLLVIDANMGQNAIAQAKLFTGAIAVTGLILTKLDGTAKGGAAIPIMKSLHIPIRFIGTGEQKEDLHVFNIQDYTDALFSSD